MFEDTKTQSIWKLGDSDIFHVFSCFKMNARLVTVHAIHPIGHKSTLSSRTSPFNHDQKNSRNRQADSS